MTPRPCEACGGSRLRQESLGGTVDNRSIVDVTAMPIAEAREFFRRLPESLSERDRTVARQILKELNARLGFLVDVGLDYLTLDRPAATLSGGEAQRIRLGTQIGSQLMGVLYILDEPSIGLHQRDNKRLIETLKRLRDLGNTVLVVEHDEETIHEADYVVDLGPGAGEHGGDVVVVGPLSEVLHCSRSITGQYLRGVRRIPVPARRRNGNSHTLTVLGARENNLKSIDVRIPLGKLVCITGVSGSGKSSLLIEIVYKHLSQALHRSKERPGAHDGMKGIQHLNKVIDIDQSPIGRTPRSNPATYTGLFGPIRNLFASLPEAKLRGYKPGRFSFNVKGGRCEACQGDGIIKIEMQFLPDVYVPCEVCHGKRYNREALEIRYRGKSIADVLDLSIKEAVAFFEEARKAGAAVPRSVTHKLRTLRDLGLGYLTLGHPATKLSGGEAQRVKLARELAKMKRGNHNLYILDEPTTGLHAADIEKLLLSLNRLVDAGHTVLVIEHHLDVVKTADWIIDLGPDGGDAGGRLVAQGTPEAVAGVAESHTGKYLQSVL
jgi:excinuclease ABC subunit A